MKEKLQYPSVEVATEVFKECYKTFLVHANEYDEKLCSVNINNVGSERNLLMILAGDAEVGHSIVAKKAIEKFSAGHRQDK